MPASARLLQKLKETWGDEVTQDLVTWVNEGQTVNQEERVALSEARLDQRINGVLLEIARLEARMNAGVAGLRAEIASQMRDQMKWMLIFWAGTMVPLAGLIVALGKAWL